MFFIDRIEEGLGVIFEDDKFIENVSVKNIKGNVRDGAVIVKRDGCWAVDEVATAERTEKMRKRLDRLFK